MKKKWIALIVIIGVLLLSCFSGVRKKAVYSEDRATIYHDELLQVFGEDCQISEGQLMTGYYWDKDSNMPDKTKPYSYIQWQIDYTNAYGEHESLRFDNRARELVQAVRNHMTNLVQSYYTEKFFESFLKDYPNSDCVMECGFYPLFSDPKRPETAVMLDQRLDYQTNAFRYLKINELKYDTVFAEYPVTLGVYCKIRYEDNDVVNRQKQVDRLTQELHAIANNLIAYTHHTLNAHFNTIMLNPNGGFSDDYFFGILQGQYYEGDDYQKALHENFFGPINAG